MQRVGSDDDAGVGERENRQNYEGDGFMQKMFEPVRRRFFVVFTSEK